MIPLTKFDFSFDLMGEGGGGQIFVNSFLELISVYKKTHVQVWNVWILILFVMPHNLTIYSYKLLQAFPQKHL